MTFNLHDEVTVETIHGPKPGVVCGKAYGTVHYDVRTDHELLQRVLPDKVRPRDAG